MATVRLREVSKSYGPVRVIEQMNLDIGAGEFVVFVGQSGCGKSTLLRMIAGLEDVTAGEVLIGARDVTRLEPAKRSIAMVFQSYALYPQMTVAENIGFGLKVAGLDARLIRERTAQVAKTLRLTEFLERRPRELSGGQRQRVAIGRAIARQPAVFLFDEPLSNLDAALRGDMRIQIAQLHNSLGVTSIYVTHDQVEAMTLADRIVVLEKGRIQQIGSPIEIYERPANRFVAEFIGTPRMNFVGAVPVGDDAEFSAVQLPSGARIPFKGVRRRLNSPANDTGGAMTMGIRPQHLEAVAAGAPDAIAGRVVVVEQLGSETFAYVETPEDATLAVRFESGTRLRQGEVLAFRPRADRLHVFAQDGRAIEASARPE